MKWLLTIETENDLIVVCRLMNIFRRKGLRLLMLAMAETAEGYSLMAVVETPAADGDHYYNFVRRTEGVRSVTCYRQQTTELASHVFVDLPEGRPPEVARWEGSGARLIFATHGKMLYELPVGANIGAFASAGATLLPFTCAMTTRESTDPPTAY
ncbi:MAG: hypothetical protein ACRD2B_07645 [Terriglobia bacterium]